VAPTCRNYDGIVSRGCVVLMVVTSLLRVAAHDTSTGRLSARKTAWGRNRVLLDVNGPLSCPLRPRAT
jgi:hypothetical protein